MPEKNNFVLNLISGGFAGFCEAITCHPLDTIKVRMQLRKTTDLPNRILPNYIGKGGPLSTAKNIVQNEGFFALYKGIGAVLMGIIPKIAIRFVSFEHYKQWITKKIHKNGFKLDKMTNFIGKQFFFNFE